MSKVTKRERSPSPPSQDAGKRQKQENISDISEGKQEAPNSDFFEDKEGNTEEAATAGPLSNNWEDIGSSESISSYASVVDKGKTPQGRSKVFGFYSSSMVAHTCVTNASFLTEKEYTEYLLWPPVAVEAIVPSCLVNRRHKLSYSAQREVNGNGEIKALYERHFEIQEKYAPGKCPLVGKNPAEQVKINRDIRDAIQSHVSTWFWNCGGINQHMRSLQIKDVHEVMNMMQLCK